MKILITGASGLIGSRVVELLKDKYEIVGAGRDVDKIELENKRMLDITSKEEVEKVLEETKPDFVLHLAALANLEKCEENPSLARKINVEGTRNLVLASKKIGAFFIYFSTGFIFKGDKGYYKEDDLADPQNVYGRTKYEGELLVQNSSLCWAIIRLNYPYRVDKTEKKDGMTWIKEKLSRGEEISLVKDQFLSPVSIDKIVAFLDEIISEKKEGIFHVVDNFHGSWVDLGYKIAKENGFDVNLIKEISYDDFLEKSGRLRAPIDVSLVNTRR